MWNPREPLVHFWVQPLGALSALNAPEGPSIIRAAFILFILRFEAAPQGIEGAALAWMKLWDGRTRVHIRKILIRILPRLPEQEKPANPRSAKAPAAGPAEKLLAARGESQIYFNL